MKKLFTLLLAVAAGAGAMFAEKVQIGDLYYNLNETDKTAEVTSECNNENNYSGLRTANIPASVVYNEVEYSVTSIEIGAFTFCSNLAFVTIPKSVTNIEGVFCFGCLNLKAINVDADNPNFCSIDGVLFNKDKTQIIQYPCGKQGAYSIPNSVTSIGETGAAFGYCSGLTSINIPNSVTSIGESTFYGCINLTSIVIGNGVKEIKGGTFIYCPLKDITIGTGLRKISLDAFMNVEIDGVSKYGEPMPKWDATGNFIYTVEKVICYSKVPPTIEIPSYGGDFKAFLDNFLEADIYVPQESVARYQAYNDTWGKLGILPIEAATTDVTDLIVTPSSSSAEITWPQVSGAASYELVIKDKSGNVVCTLIFNALGQLTSIAFNAPSRDGAQQRTQTAGFAFTVTGLEQGTSYDLTVTAKDNNGNIIDEKQHSFHTDWAENVENILENDTRSQKLLHNNQILILRGDKAYTITGQLVK